MFSVLKLQHLILITFKNIHIFFCIKIKFYTCIKFNSYILYNYSKQFIFKLAVYKQSQINFLRLYSVSFY